jgi:hypothetical protein
MKTLEDVIKEAARSGLCDLAVRVARYDATFTKPEAWQAIAKYRQNAGGPWGIGIRGNATAAIRAALEDGGLKHSSILNDAEDVFE